ncbi:MAG: phosphatase PAP2 family protein [Bacteroidales bacterium]
MNFSQSVRDFLIYNIFSRFMYIFIIVGAVPLFYFEQGDLVLLMNEYWGGPVLDVVFSCITFLGNGSVFIITFMLFLLYSYKKSVFIGVSGIFVLLASGFLKHIVFGPLPRPTAFLDIESFFYIIPDFRYAQSFSFPSGHTMTAFAFFSAVSFLTRNKQLQYVYVLIACLVGISRMYLLLHFYRDVYAGAIVGVALTILAVSVVQKINVSNTDGLFYKKLRKEE